MKTRTYYRSFAGGEISPEMFGRIDDAKYQSGAATARNFIVNPTGAAKNRAGFAYVSATKNNGVARLASFTFDIDQTMVIELGQNYARFHTQGATLKYGAGSATAWAAPSSSLSYTLTTPAVITWTAHGLATGNPIRFYVATPGVMPGGLQLGYTYTVNVLTANTFNITDPATGLLVAFDGSTSSGTNYAAATNTSTTLFLGPNGSGNTTSSAVAGLSSTPVSGVITLNLDIETTYSAYQGGAQVEYQYSADNGTTWYTAYTSSEAETTTVSVQIGPTNLNQVQVRVFIFGSCGPSGSVTVTGAINSWSVTVGGSTGALAVLGAFYDYAAGLIVSYTGSYYVAVSDHAGGTVTPGTNAAIWYQLPSDFTYEIPTPYVAADLFDVRYVQSADVMTLVHPNYPPAELSRLGATQWRLATIVFGPPLAAPTGVAVSASPGYLAKISSVATGGTGYTGQALITTAASHTLALGNGVYVANLTFTPSVGAPQVLDGFYMVAAVPVDGAGNLIKDQLYLMDYSGNNLMFNASGTYSSGATIQFGTKIFNITNPYAVQALAADGVSTSPLSASVSVLNNLDVPGSFNTVAWSTVNGGASYNVYKQLNGLWGFIGNTKSLNFTDNNIAPDMGITPGIPDTVFTGAGNYPSTVCYFQQRRCFGATLKAPQNVWMSNSGTESMFSYSLPSQATDRLAFKVAALNADAIEHMLPMTQLLLMTSTGEFALVPVSSDVITPSTIDAKAQSYTGASGVQPTIVNTSAVYAAARGGHVREIRFAWTVNGFSTGDLSLRAAHLFDGLKIVDQAYAKAPYPVIWFVSSNGNLLGLTYIPEEQLGAWHHHDTAGTFESITCVAEGGEDFVYAVIGRTINGQSVRYIERMASRMIDPKDFSTWFFVDAGVTQTFGSPVSTISGLTWLEGATVEVLADGGLQAQKVVTGGAITLDHAAKVVTVGLPITADLETLPPVLQLDGFGQGCMKNINKGWVKVYQSSGILLGPDVDHLTEIRTRTTEPFGSPPSLQTAELEVLSEPSWQQSGQVFLRQTKPLPLDVVGLTLEVSVGG